MGLRVPLLGTTVLVLLVASLTVVEAWQFNVVHKYAHLEGSPASSDDGSMSPEYFETLVEHHHQRRRLLAAPVFNLGGNGDLFGDNAVGLYYTEIGLGTPAKAFYVQVDTGSDVLWVDCTPCIGCPTNSSLPGVTVNPYDPTLSSTDKTLPCSSPDCAAASNSQTGAPACDANGACSFDIVYGDGSNVTGSILTDIFTFVQYPNSTASELASTDVYFGCGSTLGGFEDSQVGGLMGFGKSPVAVPQQLAAQNLSANEFAHCLQGDVTIGGGLFVIANITEPDLVFTPQVPQQGLYNVGLQNIAVGGANVTTPASFEITAGNAGVIMDSGTTLATVAEPAFTQFLDAVSNAVLPIQAVPIQGYTCWPFSGDLATTFPSVTLFFDGGAMNLGPQNYLLPMTDPSGAYQCLGWVTGTLPTSTESITIWGDIVLKDQLIVYDNDLQRIGWKPFNCSGSIQVSF